MKGNRFAREARHALGFKNRMRTNRVKTALQTGRTVLGSEIARLPGPEVPRIYAAAGLDFVFIDMEHTPFGLESVADMVRAARAADIVPLVRVPEAEYAWVARVLDVGAQGLIVPRVNTPEQVNRIVRWMRYPPHGVRGFARTYHQTEGRDVPADAFIEAAHAQTLLVIQIERRESLDNLEAMLSIPHVDVACLGFMDLSVDLGIPGQVDHPDMVSGIEKLIRVSRRHDVAPGIISPSMALAHRWAARGMRFVSYGSAARLLQEAATEAVQTFRAGLAAPSPQD